MFIVACQVFTHVCMLIKPFDCNPNSGRTCNKLALCAGFVSFLAFSKAIALDGQRNPCILFATVVSMYSIISHIVHIDMNGMIRIFFQDSRLIKN